MLVVELVVALACGQLWHFRVFRRVTRRVRNRARVGVFFSNSDIFIYIYIASIDSDIVLYNYILLCFVINYV